jgi:hypothetical protein
MLIACIDYMSYGVLPWIPLHSVIVDIDDNGHPFPLLVQYNEGLLYTYCILMVEVFIAFHLILL